MPPEPNTTPDTPQPVPESQSPTVDTPALATEPTTPPQEAAPAPTETEQPAEGEPITPPTQTAQVPPNEPLPPEPEPFDSAPDSAKATPGTQDKPTPEPPSAAASTPTLAHPIRDFLTRARIATQDRKSKKRDKIMFALATKNKITNDEVEKLLHVSDATATRYLSALEKEGKIKQVGKTGTGVVYSKI